MTRQTISTQVTDTNHQPRGAMTIEVECDDAGPSRVLHEGRAYWFTGKEGTKIANGQPVREMATESDARLWVTLDAKALWED